MKVNAMSNETTNPGPPAAASIPHRPSNRLALLVLAISFVINVAFWGTLIYWAGRTVRAPMAVGRCAVFVLVMAGVHLIG
jgi:hypothetical protein